MHRPKRWWPFYLGWIAFCAILFLAVSGLEDPSRPKGRILSIEAGNRALAIAAQQGLRDYSVVHVGRDDERWVVLLDRIPHTRLKEAVVVELRVDDGRLLTIRKPVR